MRYMLCAAAIILCSSVGAVTSDDPDVHRWPGWKGPVGGGVAPDPGFELVENLGEARLVWESEHTIPLGVEKGPGWGSFSSPAVDDGRVFLCYVRTPGQKEFTIPKGRRSTFEGNWRVEDVMHCFDAKTGKTLWRYVYPKGQRGTGGKDGGHYTPCTDSGYVCAVGSGGRLYCVKADTGEFVWETWMETEGNNPKSYQALIEESYQTGRNLVGTGLNHAPGAVNGVVAMGFSRKTVKGFDIKTGEQLWSIDVQGCTAGRGATPIPVIWKHRDKRYFVAADTAIEPRTGAVIWQLPGAITETAPCVTEDYYVSSGYEKGGEESGRTCWRVGLDGVEKLWSVKEGRPCLGGTDVICGSYFLQENQKPLSNAVLTELATGKQVGPAIGSFRMLGYSPLSCRDHVYGGLYRATDYRISSQGVACVYKAERGSHDWANSCSAAMVNGYLYHRTLNRLVCKDLAKEGARP